MTVSPDTVSGDYGEAEALHMKQQEPSCVPEVRTGTDQNPYESYDILGFWACPLPVKALEDSLGILSKPRLAQVYAGLPRFHAIGWTGPMSQQNMADPSSTSDLIN
ncbi:hypothetical protein BDP27DRAFT_1420819 [Rhodocollybia butyracea]|uniref:Uncharacterized protein n=1 Tax=Rhodocollybia butyracea TaxID=206335 RepID=A0A9P5PPG9_9AGAR|nr:hypothetical protein BDP27DRAFT_1420819 [Rhodocollybia butyracea]